MKLKKLAAGAVLALAVCGTAAAGGTKEASAEALSATGAFDWKRFSGQEITVFMVQHSTTDAVLDQKDTFEKLTGIKVNVQVTPEANYFDQVSNALSSRKGNPDLFMTGVYQMWDYSTAGNVEPLDAYLNNASLTNTGYDFKDIIPSVASALRWDKVPGHAAGTGDLYALPLGCEVYALAYNKRAFAKAGITKVPETYDELLEACDKLKGWNGPDSFAIAIRGARDWGTIHPGYMSTYANFGAKEFEIEGKKLVSRVNSPESIAMNTFWVDLVRRGGSPQWSSQYWYMAQADLGAGKAAMMFDADNAMVQVDLGDYAEKGNVAFAKMPVAKAGDKFKSNFWIWAMSMNSYSKNKGAAWLFLQYFTSKDFLVYASVTKNNMDPVRTSVWNDSGFRTKLGSVEGFFDTFNATAPNAAVLFTPQPAFFQTTYNWAEALQDMVAGQDVKTRLDKLKTDMDAAAAAAME